MPAEAGPRLRSGAGMTPLTCAGMTAGTLSVADAVIPAKAGIQ